MKVSVLALVLLSGCYGGVSVARVGRPYPEKAPTCALTFDYVNQKSAMRLLAGYYEVAVLERTAPNDFAWTKDVQEELRPYACRVGGDLVAFDGWSDVGQDIARRTYGRFIVYRTKESSDAIAQ